MLALSEPLIYTLELTPACNNQCPGCSNPFEKARSNPCLTGTEWQLFLRNVGPRAARIRLTGGEPTFHPQFQPILETAASFDAAVTIFTNARWRHPKQLIKIIKRLKNVAGLLVSLHGATQTSHEKFTKVTGSFEETTANIKLALGAGIRVALSVVVNRFNFEEIGLIYELGRQWGVDHVAYNRFIGDIRSEHYLEPARMRQAVGVIDNLIAQGAPVEHSICVPQCFSGNFRDAPEQCLAGVASICVDPWGNLRPCLYSKTVIGSIRATSLADLWHSPVLKEWRGRSPTGCKVCSQSENCHGGCRAASEFLSEPIDPLYVGPILDSGFQKTIELPPDAKPVLAAAIRQEAYGIVLLGTERLLIVSAEALPVLEACDGTNTFTELFSRLNSRELELLAQIWEAGSLRLV
jgi:radical SAM protein with 4Fe4S-binding SPASM domain